MSRSVAGLIASLGALSENIQISRCCAVTVHPWRRPNHLTPVVHVEGRAAEGWRWATVDRTRITQRSQGGDAVGLGCRARWAEVDDRPLARESPDDRHNDLSPRASGEMDSRCGAG